MTFLLFPKAKENYQFIKCVFLLLSVVEWVVLKECRLYISASLIKATSLCRWQNVRSLKNQFQIKSPRIFFLNHSFFSFHKLTDGWQVSRWDERREVPRNARLACFPHAYWRNQNYLNAWNIPSKWEKMWAWKTQAKKILFWLVFQCELLLTKQNHGRSSQLCLNNHNFNIDLYQHRWKLSCLFRCDQKPRHEVGI